MNKSDYQKELSKCTKCGACKSLCPTYLSVLNETMGARGRVLMLGGFTKNELAPTAGLSDDIFSCILCEACKDQCPIGIDIPEVIYEGRKMLRGSFKRGGFIRLAARLSMDRLDTAFAVLKIIRKLFLRPLYGTGWFRYIPPVASTPFRKSVRLYKNIKRKGRVAIFAGCSVNYLHPNLGKSLYNVLVSKGYETVVLKGEVCCGAPMRSIGLEEEAIDLAKKNIELFKKLRVEATLCLCPTCTMVIKNQYPVIAGDSIPNVMDVNEFFARNNITEGLELPESIVTYHDPCHLSYGLGVRKEPREILKSIKGLSLVEMEGSEECCGFGGFFSTFFKELSRDIGRKKIDRIKKTGAGTVVTSCPGCMMQFEDIIRSSKGPKISIKHIVEVVDEAMHG